MKPIFVLLMTLSLSTMICEGQTNKRVVEEEQLRAKSDADSLIENGFVDADFGYHFLINELEQRGYKSMYEINGIMYLENSEGQEIRWKRYIEKNGDVITYNKIRFYIVKK